ncbi:AraC-like DNA-binding protein [Micromonospora sp. M71_S20]|uniref:helix-turn-helix domain-containing protein n=1 Tax=Micromonospora sp. M71_S20 TaxID=592872 RepID=UPI000EB0194D|nr:helix-turn-helix domain-containing protein [Micromonospora sp. M71_S20]RLK23518.1 AraC-like DNA-binding protein [Micromonospora sp. M71_S20]
MPEGIGSDPRLMPTPCRWRVLGHPAGISISEAHCVVEYHGWLAPTVVQRHRIILGRSGAYRRRINGRTTFSDATSLLLTRPGDEMQVSHPLGCDTFTCLEIEPAVLAEHRDGARWLATAGWDGTSDTPLDLAHRMLVTEFRRGLDPFEMAERLHGFVGRVLDFVSGRAEPPGADLGRVVGRRPATAAAHRRLADRAREVLMVRDFSLTLDQVAREVGASPHHLSRVFQRVTGSSLTAYRNRLRVQAVLDTLAEADGRPLRAVAAEHGFADQAHLTRVLREHVGHPPARLRRLLAQGRPD